MSIDNEFYAVDLEVAGNNYNKTIPQNTHENRSILCKKAQVAKVCAK